VSTAPEPRFRPQPVRRASAAQQIAAQIRQAMRAGELAAGERLPSELELASAFGVSRPTVREAMRILAASNLVEASRGAGGGTFVALPGTIDVAEALGETIELWFQAGSTTAAEVDDARALIERGCVRLAAEHRTDTDLLAIRAAVDAAREPDLDTDLFLALDLEFHVAISRAAHNSVLELAMTAIHLVRPRTNTLLVAVLRHQPIVDQHQAIYDAIQDRDPDAAEAAFDVHVTHLMEVQREALAQRDAHDIQIGTLTEAHPAIDILKSRPPWSALTAAQRPPGDRGRSHG
jgi:GntR family transcriptional regulator, transcriptional repressor for pyruvate dehydrogenase complex